MLPIEAFLTGPGRTALGEEELLVAVEVPAEGGAGSRWGPAARELLHWRKVGMRRANALAKVSLAGRAVLEGGALRELRLALGAVAPTVVRSREAERELVSGSGPAAAAPAGQLRTTRSVVERLYGPLLSPIDDQRSTAAYRRQAALNMIGELLVLCGRAVPAAGY